MKSLQKTIFAFFVFAFSQGLAASGQKVWVSRSWIDGSNTTDVYYIRKAGDEQAAQSYIGGQDWPS